MEPHIVDYGSHERLPTAVTPTASQFDPRRLYTVAVLAPVIYAVIRYLPPILFIGLVLVVGAIALYEFYRLFFRERANGILIGIGFGTLVLWLGSYHWSNPRSEILFLGVVAALLLPLFVTRKNLHDHLIDSTITLFGVLYIGLALSYLVMIRSFPKGEYLVLFLLLVTWAADTGAYYVGKTFGRHPLAPAISPKKTVEGLVGGLALAIVATYACRSWMPAYDLTVLNCLFLGSFLTIAGLAGDLAESAVKRSTGMKDSSGLLPGHGGMLDRIDSLLFTAPAFYYYVSYSGLYV